MNILELAILKKMVGGGGGSGTDSYNDLSNLPKINDVTLSGNKSSSALGLQSEITSDSKLASDLVDDTNQDNKFVTSAEKTTWNGKQNAIDADHKINADYVDDSTSTNKFVTASDKETWNAKQNAIDNSHKLSSDLVDDANHTNKFVTSTEKQTWNAKQNAIDADHKLSSSLVSFSEAEAAAIASGIDSSKVGQISTNQSNILYAINTGVKNIAFLKNGTYRSASGGSETTFVVENGVVTVTSTIADTRATIMNYVTLEAGTYIITNRQEDGRDVRLRYNGVDYIDTFTINSATTFEVRAYSYKVLTNATITPLLCIKSVYDQDSSYQPPALPNYDLTYLQAEDRAALAEEIDAGAKNLINCSVDNIKSLNSTSLYSWNGNAVTAYGRTATVNADGTITVAAGTGSAEFWLKVANYTYASGVSYVLSGCPANGSTTTYYMESDNLNLRDIGSGVVINSATTDALYIVVKTTGSTPALTFKPMLCTKVAFGVSNKFVPYRPSWDLVYSSLQCDVKYAKVPVSTSYSLIGSIKTKGNRVCRITVTQEYASVAPTGLILSKSNQSSDFNTLSNRVAPPVETTTDDINLTISALCYFTYDRVVYIWAKAKTASTNGNNFMALCEHFGDIDGVKNSMT